MRVFHILCLVILCQTVFAQRLIKGLVQEDQTGEPLVGASVVVAGSNPVRGTLTDAMGNFELSVQPTDRQLVVSFTGYDSREVTLTDMNYYTIAMKPGQLLDELVVIGYGSVKKEDLTGSVVSVSSKDFQTGNISTPEQLIAGKVAGVSIVTNGGAPGSGSQIRIRGGSSLNASNDPLIVVDGVPLDLTGISGSANPLSLINPNDIETFTVLKDASATAIYGSRASNGVIIITTKKGAAGKKMTFGFSTINSLSQITRKVQMLDADRFRQAVKDKAPQVPAFQDLPGSANTDWQDEIYRLAVSSDNNFNISGGGKALPYRLSLGFLDQNGILLRSNMKRYSAGLGLSPALMDGKLRFDINLRSSLSNHVFANEGAIGAAVAFDPTQPVLSGDAGKYNGYYEWLDNAGKPNVLAPRNPVGLIMTRDDLSNVFRSIGNVATDYRFHFLPELRAHLNLGFDIARSSGTVFVDSTAAQAFNRKGVNNYYEQQKDNKLLDFYLNYNKELKGLNSRIDATAGYSYQDFIRRDSSIDRSLSGTVFNNPIYKTQNTLVSFFSRLNYDIASKYLLTLTLRNDGSSRFSPETRWGLFPAAAAAWRVKNESFLKDITAVSDMKIRLGWGVTGQQDVFNDYPYLPRITPSEPSATYPLGDTYYTTFRPEGYDARIKWEETTTYNAGIDMGFAENRVTTSIDLYRRITTDLLSTIPVPAGSNLTNQILTNIGSLENRGVEVALGFDAIRRQNINWNIATNLTFNENKITKLTQVNDPNYLGIQTGGISGGVGNTIQIHSVGYARGSFFVLEQLYDEDGKPIEGNYADKNGDGKFTLDDRFRIHQPDPKIFAGLTSNLSVYKWTFGMVARGNFGQHVYNNVASNLGAWQNISNSTRFLSNLNESVTRSNFTKNQFFSDYYLERADFVRIDNLSLTRNLVRRNNFGLSASAIIQNAFVFTRYTGIDPEHANGIDNNIYPRPRTYSVALNLQF